MAGYYVGLPKILLLLLLTHSLSAQNSTTDLFKLNKPTVSLINSPQCANDIPSQCKQEKLGGTSNLKTLVCLHNQFKSMATLDPQCQNVKFI